MYYILPIYSSSIYSTLHMYMYCSATTTLLPAGRVSLAASLVCFWLMSFHLSNAVSCAAAASSNVDVARCAQPPLALLAVAATPPSPPPSPVAPILAAASSLSPSLVLSLSLPAVVIRTHNVGAAHALARAVHVSVGVALWAPA